jgi:hypothetical protein
VTARDWWRVTYYLLGLVLLTSALGYVMDRVLGY